MRRILAPIALTAALAAWYLTPWPWLAAVWAVSYAALAWRWPRWALALLPLTFPFWYAPLHVTSRLTFPLSEAALAIVTAVTLAQFGWRLARLSGERRRRYLNGWPRAFLRQTGWLVPLGATLLLLGMTVGVIIARQPHDALRAWRWEIAEPLVFAALVVWRLRVRWVWRMLWAFIASGLIVVALAVAQATFAHMTVAALANGGGLIPYHAWSGLGWRTTAIIYGNPNSAGDWMARALPLALAVALWPRAAAERERLIAALAILALLLGMELTGSRGALLGALAGVAVVALCVVWVNLSAADQTAPQPYASEEKGLRRFAPFGFALVAALVYGGSVLWLEPLVRLIGGTAHGGSGAIRLLIWQAALAMAHDHQLLGVGPDQFLYYYDPQYTHHPYLIATQNGHPTAAASEPNLSHPHNLGLELWLSAGIVGLYGFMLVVVAALARGWATIKALRKRQALHGWRSAAIAGTAGALVVALAHGLVDSAYFQPDLALAFWGMVAALLVLAWIPRQRSTVRS